MSRLNYNKWDALELSDDSDIEVHPNVDKKSMIRWKQRDIHEKRDARRQKLANLAFEQNMNASLLVRLSSIISSTTSSPTFIRSEILRLRSVLPDFDTPLAPGVQPSENHMILALLLQVRAAVDGANGAKTEVGELEGHKLKLKERQKEIAKEIEHEEKEQKKLITSDDMHVGFDSKTMISPTPSVIPQGSAPAPVRETGQKKKSKTVQETVIETINSPSSSSHPPQPTLASLSSESDSSAEEENAPTLTADAVAFSHLPSLNFEQCYKFISAHPTLLTEDTTDALLVEAFSKAMKGEDKLATQFIEKSLMIQYALKLGRDGVTLFFKRMTASDPRALQVFLDDLRSTSKRIIDRAHVLSAEKKASQSAGTEQIQLVPADENMTITFETPDGPPHENLEITGEGSESLDPVAVREYLQRRWDIFTSFPPNLQKALTKKSLEAVNKVLGKMAVEEAEEVVALLQEGGILSFDEGGIRDETGKGESEREVVAGELD